MGIKSVWGSLCPAEDSPGLLGTRDDVMCRTLRSDFGFPPDVRTQQWNVALGGISLTLRDHRTVGAADVGGDLSMILFRFKQNPK